MIQRIFFSIIPLVFMACGGGSGAEATPESFSQNVVKFATDGTKLRTLLPNDGVVDSILKCPKDSEFHKDMEKTKEKITKMNAPKEASVKYKSSTVTSRKEKKKGEKYKGCDIVSDFAVVKIDVVMELTIKDKSKEDKNGIKAITINNKWYLTGL